MHVRAGHTSVAFALDRYGHLLPAMMRSYAIGWTPCTPRASELFLLWLVAVSISLLRHRELLTLGLNRTPAIGPEV